MNVWPVALAYAALFARKRQLALRYLAENRTLPGATNDARPEPATIVQPILSGDPRLAETLEHNVREIENAAFVWLVDAEDRVALDVCAAIAARHPQRDVRVVTCPPAAERDNPKLFKLALAEAHVRTDALVVVDDDTMLTATGYAALLAALETHALATGLPEYVSGADLPSALVEQFVDNSAALTYLAWCAQAPPITINGMCYALRTSTVARIGGFGTYLRWLPDDLAIAHGVRGSGGSIHQTPYAHRIRTTVRDAAHYASLMHRWYLFALLLLASAPVRTRVAIVANYALPSLLLWTVLGGALLSRTPANAVAAATLLATRALALADVQRRTYGRSRHRPLVSIVAELAEPLHALHALARKTIRWRSRRIVVRGADDFSVVR